MAESGDAGKAVVLLREADALWEGEALGGLPGDWFTRMRLSLAEERRAATLMCIGLELELGHHVDLLAELQRLMAQYPLDETVVSAHMTALYRSGRVTEALEIYRQAHTSLTGQGIEPAATRCWPSPPCTAVPRALGSRILSRPRPVRSLAETARSACSQASPPPLAPP
jgi:hypothetical protein